MTDKYNKAKIELQQSLAKIIKEYRTNQNKSISKISAEIMMSKSLWLDLEKGIKDPQLSTLWRVCEALDIPLEIIIAELKKKLGSNFSLLED